MGTAMSRTAADANASPAVQEERSSDAGLAVALAEAAGERLLAVRAELTAQGVGGRELKDAGDAAAQAVLAALLAEHRPDDAVLSEEAADDHARLSAQTGSGSSTRSTAPASSPSRTGPTGPCTWRCGRRARSWQAP